MFTLLFIAMLTATTVAWFVIQRLQDKPWTEQGVLPASQDDVTSSAPKVGLWAFLGVVTSVFTIFTGAYFMRMDVSHGGVASGIMHAWVPIDEPPLLWINTIVLMLASAALETAKIAANRVAIESLRRAFIATCGLTLLFLASQVFAWQLVAGSIDAAPSSPSYAFFVLLTAVHGLHLLGGLFVLTRATARIWGGIDSNNVVAIGAVRQTVQLCATYWHFLLVVWVALFTMLIFT